MLRKKLQWDVPELMVVLQHVQVPVSVIVLEGVTLCVEIHVTMIAPVLVKAVVVVPADIN